MKGAMKLIVASAIIAVGFTAMAWAGDVPAKPTFNKDILPIFQKDCQACHRESGANLSGMVAPMALTSYKEVRPWAKAIARSVQIKKMPPWYAAPQHHGQFENERILSDVDIQTIVKWVKIGAPRGNPKDAPEPVNWPQSGWTIGGGDPDLIVAFDEPNWVGDDVDDLYQNITVKIPIDKLPEDRWLQAIEFKPGSEVVHHIIAYQATPGEDGAMTSGMLGGEAPGTDPTTFPDGYGVIVPAGSTVTFQMHYHKEAGPGTGVFDNTSFAMEFHTKPVDHQVRVEAIDHGAFEIPPGHARWRVGGAQTFDADTTILGFMPHLHLRGIACKYTAYYPDGTSEVLLDVPEYDFNWQIFYEYKDAGLKNIPAGTRVEFEMWYDNSKERADAIGFSAERPVSFGGPTWDEMDLGWINYAKTEPDISLGAGD